MRKIRTMTAIALPCVLAGLSMPLAAEEMTGRKTETSMSLGVNVTEGDSDTMTLNAGIRSEITTEVHEWMFSAEGNYGETETETEVDGTVVRDSETTTQNAKGTLNYKRTFGRSYAYNEESILHDDIAGVEYRLIAGVGMGYRVVDADDAELGIELGGAYVKEELEADEGDDYFAIRMAAECERDLSKTSQVRASIEYLPQASDWEDYLLTMEAGVESMLNASLSLRVVVQDRYDSTPAAGAEKNNLQVIGSMVYTL